MYLNLWFKWAQTTLVVDALSQHTHLSMYYSCIILLHCIDCVLLYCRCLSPFSRRCSEDVIDDTDEELYYLQKCQESKTPLSIPLQYHSLAPTLFYYIRTTTIQLLHAAVVEPLSSAWHVIATVNRWHPLAWVGVVWALMCLLIHDCCHACYCLELSQVWFIRDESEACEHVLLCVS